MYYVIYKQTHLLLQTHSYFMQWITFFFCISMLKSSQIWAAGAPPAGPVSF